MKKKRINLLLAVLLMVAVVMMFSACGSSSYDRSAESIDDGYYYESNDSQMGLSAGYGYDGDEMDIDAGDSEYDAAEPDVKGKAYDGDTSAPANKKNLKLIYRASVSVQTVDFDKTVGELKELVKSCEGYFEAQEVYNGGYYNDGTYKNGYYTVRVPSDKYDGFINSLGESCHVVNMSQSVEDIGQAYYDTETHVESLKIKIERLQGLLKEASKMSDIIELENALSSAEYELELYQSTLRDYDSLVDYSTISVQVEKVSALSTGVTEEITFGERLANSLKNGLINFSEGVQNVAVWVGYNLIQLIILAVIIVLLIRFRPFAGLFERIRRNKAAAEKTYGMSRAEKKAYRNRIRQEKKQRKAELKAQGGNPEAKAESTEDPEVKIEGGEAEAYGEGAEASMENAEYTVIDEEK